MKMNRNLLCLLVVVLISGCAGVPRTPSYDWVHPTGQELVTETRENGQTVTSVRNWIPDFDGDLARCKKAFPLEKDKQFKVCLQSKGWRYIDVNAL